MVSSRNRQSTGCSVAAERRDTMPTGNESERGTGSGAGTIMVVTWMIVIGPLGALLLGGIAYAMFVKSLVAGLICGLLFFLPLLLTLTWGINTWSEILREKKSNKASFVLTTRPIATPTRSLES